MQPRSNRVSSAYLYTKQSDSIWKIDSFLTSDLTDDFQVMLCVGLLLQLEQPALSAHCSLKILPDPYVYLTTPIPHTYNMASSYLVLGTSFALVSLVWIFTGSKRGRGALPLPPGPRGLPIIGVNSIIFLTSLFFSVLKRNSQNVADMPKQEEWITFAEWGRKWGAQRDQVQIDTNFLTLQVEYYLWSSLVDRSSS